LLFYIANRYSQYLQQSANYCVAYVELSDANCRTLDGLLKTILQRLGAGEMAGNKSALAEFQDAIVALNTGGKHPVVCLDEFEELTDHPDQFTLDLYDSWRYLINQHAVAFVTGSKTPLIDLQELGFSSPFFNVFTHLPLGELTDDEARELIARCAECDRPFTPIEQSEAMLLAGNHPYRLQLAGSLAYEAKANGRAVDWAKLRNGFMQQLKQVGLEVDWKRSAKKFGREHQTTIFSWLQELGKMLFDMIRGLPR